MAKKIKETEQDWKNWVANIKQGEVPKSSPIRDTNIDRKQLDLQRFMNDMQTIGDQVRSGKIKKPTFNYGDLSVTNYLLWLILAELMIQNTKSELGGE